MLRIMGFAPAWRLICVKQRSSKARFHHAAHLRRGVVPPLLHEQEWLVDRVERPALPVQIAEAPVLLERLDAGLGAPRHCAGKIRADAVRFAQRVSFKNSTVVLRKNQISQEPALMPRAPRCPRRSPALPAGPRRS